jgi:hypothetical protein
VVVSTAFSVFHFFNLLYSTRHQRTTVAAVALNSPSLWPRYQPLHASTCSTFGPLQLAHRKKPSQAQVAVFTPAPPPVPSASTPTPQAAAHGIADPQTPQWEGCYEVEGANSLQGSTKANNNVETPTLAQTAASTPTLTSSTRGAGDDTDAPTPGVGFCQTCAGA